VAEGTILMTPEMAGFSEFWLPLGVNMVSKEAYGGGVRMVIAGDAVEDGKEYQIVVSDGPLKRSIEIVKNPNQDG
jgi:hypothetical protein